MASSVGNNEPGGTVVGKSQAGICNGTTKSTATLAQRINFHDKLHEGSKCDLETPASIVANVNIKQLLTPAAFDSLPTRYQNELITLLPECDRLSVDDTQTPLAMTVTALSNEFFAKSCVEYRDRLKNGEFSSSASSRTDIDPVIWECDSGILSQKLIETDVPKAGEPFICTPKEDSKKSVRLDKPTKHKLRTENSKVSDQTVKTSKNSSTNKSALAASKKERTTVAGVKRSQSAVLRNNSGSQPVSAPSLVTKLQKVTESNAAGDKVTKVVPVVVRNPHGQVVTTLADCNPLLSEMIRNPQITLSPTTVPGKVERKRHIIPTILKKNNPVVVTLKTSKMGSNTNGETINKAVSEVLSKLHTPPPNGTSPTKSVIVTVNGATNGTTVPHHVVSQTVNMERSRQICESSKQNQPTLNLERSYQICKQVLGKTGPSLVSVVVGAGGKKTTYVSKPVRRLPQAESISNQNVSLSDIPIYRNKHHGKPSVTLSGHVFLAMKMDADGYAQKAYKRKTAFKQKPKKKLTKSTSLKKAAVNSGQPLATSTEAQDQQPSANSLKSAVKVVTTVTDTLHATQPVSSVSESLSSHSTSNNNNNSSLLSSCMCNQKALVICQKCGAFNHAECMSKDHCLACLDSEN